MIFSTLRMASNSLIAAGGYSMVPIPPSNSPSPLWLCDLYWLTLWHDLTSSICLPENCKTLLLLQLLNTYHDTSNWYCRLFTKWSTEMYLEQKLKGSPNFFRLWRFLRADISPFLRWSRRLQIKGSLCSWGWTPHIRFLETSQLLMMDNKKIVWRKSTY